MALAPPLAALALAAGPGAASAPPPPPVTTSDGHTLVTRADRFVLDERPFDVWGIRVASATSDQAQTDHLIAQLDEYRAHGVNTVTVFYMGSSGAQYRPFSSDGRTVDAGHQDRMEQIIRAADARSMVVVVGLFYQGGRLGLRDADAVRAATRTATEALRPYRNVIIDVANEQNADTWADDADIFDMRDPARIVELARVVDEEDPERIVGGGGYDHDNNEIIGTSQHVDALLFDSTGGEDSGRLADRFVAAGVRDKPMVSVEVFGGWTREFTGGIFPDDAKAAYRSEITAGLRPELGVVFHASPWTQGDTMRYHLGGAGTKEDPGIRWYFEAVRDAVHRHSAPGGAEDGPVAPADPSAQAGCAAAGARVIPTG